MKKVVHFLENNPDIESADKLILNSLIIESEFLLAEKYYKSIFEKGDEANYEFAIEFLVKNQFESHLDYLVTLITANGKGHALLIKFYEYIENRYLGGWNEKKAPEKVEIGERYVKLLFDNEQMMNAIEGDEVPKTFGFNDHPININRINMNPFLRETKYYSIYLKDKDKLYKK